jgi:nitrogen regulatory protein PII 2
MPVEMKEILAVIRPEKWRDTQRAAMEAGAQGITQHRVLGRGRQAGLKYASATGTGESVVMSYLPKRLVSCVVPAAKSAAVVDALIKANRTGNAGDGKIFVCPVRAALRVRTEERGPAAVS